MSLHVATAAVLLAQLCLGFGWGAAASALAAAVLVTSAWRLSSPRVRLITVIGPALLGAVLGTLAMSAQRVRAPDDLELLLDDQGRSLREYELLGDVTEPPKLGVQGASAVITVRSAVGPDGNERSLGARLLLAVRQSSGKLRFGHEIRFTTRLRRITNLGNPGEFDFAAWCARRGITVSGFVWDDRDIEDLGPSSTVDTITRWRAQIAAAAARGRGVGGALTASLVVGDRSGLDASVFEALRRSGLFHLLAISGMNIAVVAGFAVWAARVVVAGARVRESGLDPLRPAALVAAVSVILYAMLSGGGDSVVRATIMGLLVLVALWRGRSGDGALGLSAAALALSLFAPGGAQDAGFQLTFVATAAVLAAVTWVSGIRWPKHMEAVASAISISFWCWAVTTPIVVYHFHRVSLVAPLAGLAASPPAGLVVIAGLIGSFLLPAAPSAANLAFDVGGWAGDAVLWVARTTASPSWAEQIVVSPGAGAACALSALPLVIVGPPRTRRRLGVTLCLLAVACSAHAALERYRTDRMDVVFTSVGQGDATIVKLPGGEVLVADAGPSGRGRTVVGPMLRRMHIGRIDYFIATHDQDDHVGGLAELAQEFPIGELWHPGGVCAGVFVDVLRALEARGTRILDVGRAWAAGRARPRRALLSRRGPAGWRLRVLWPRTTEGACVENDRSVVVSIRFAGKRVLLTGDIEATAEGILSRSKKVRADLLKVAHHGSRTSSTAVFLAAARPHAAVAMLGWANRFRFPSAEVVRRYESNGVPLFRTDRDGAVRATVSREGVRIAASRPATEPLVVELPAAAR